MVACGGSGTNSNGATSSDSKGGLGTAVSNLLDPTTVYKKGETVNGKGYTLVIDSVDATPEFEDYTDADSGTEYFFASFELENTSNTAIDSVISLRFLPMVKNVLLLTSMINIMVLIKLNGILL